MADDDIDDIDDVDELGGEDLFGEAGRAKGLTDSLRKAAVAGMTALFVTEGGIRGALGELRLPKEALTYLAQQTDKTRRELFGAVSDELKGFLAGIDLPGELRKALKGLKLEVKAEVRFVEDTTTTTAEVVARPADGHDAGPRGRKKPG
jgi:hypothetical protein